MARDCFAERILVPKTSKFMVPRNHTHSIERKWKKISKMGSSKLF